jgi:hypothetical protein
MREIDGLSDRRVNMALDALQAKKNKATQGQLNIHAAVDSAKSLAECLPLCEANARAQTEIEIARLKLDS